MSNIIQNRSFILPKKLSITLYMNIGSQVQKIREHNKVSRRVLAGKLKISEQQLYKYEKNINKTPLHVLVPISHFFGVSLEYFVEEKASVLKHQNFTVKEKEVISIFSSLSLSKQNLFLKIARQFIDKQRKT